MSIERNFKRALRVEDLARERHMSARNFIRRFKTATGRTPGDYLQATRIAVAKQLLESGALSVQTVCGAVGYEDAAFFRALFKRHTGMSPAEYRERFGTTGGATERRHARRSLPGSAGPVIEAARDNGPVGSMRRGSDSLPLPVGVTPR